MFCVVTSSLPGSSLAAACCRGGFRVKWDTLYKPVRSKHCHIIIVQTTLSTLRKMGNSSRPNDILDSFTAIKPDRIHDSNFRLYAALSYHMFNFRKTKSEISVTVVFHDVINLLAHAPCKNPQIFHSVSHIIPRGWLCDIFFCACHPPTPNWR
jgi:hypothetical protein